MAFFDSFTDSIKQKWLQFFQANREWITLQMNIESVSTPDGGKRPSSYLILGVVNALEPKLAQLMFPFAKLNPNADTLIEVLDLHFDPDITLGNRLSPTGKPEIYLRESGVQNRGQGQGESLPPQGAVNQVALGSPQADWGAINDDDLGNRSLGRKDISDDSQRVGDFSNVSFNSMSLNNDGDGFNPLTSGGEDAFIALNLSEDNSFDELNTSAENGFDDVVSDIWGDETSLLNGEDNMEELPSAVFNASEMARLFPNN
ncbi:MAG: DUF5331 domain-containing protein [Cuspidothrix sp.]